MVVQRSRKKRAIKKPGIADDAREDRTLPPRESTHERIALVAFSTVQRDLVSPVSAKLPARGEKIAKNNQLHANPRTLISLSLFPGRITSSTLRADAINVTRFGLERKIRRFLCYLTTARSYPTRTLGPDMSRNKSHVVNFRAGTFSSGNAVSDARRSETSETTISLLSVASYVVE